MSRDVSIVPSVTLDLPIATQLTAAGFSVPVTPALAQDVCNHLNAGELWTVKEDCVPVGFAIVQRYFDNTLYIVGIMLMPEFRGQHVCEQVVQTTCKSTDQYLALRTASPIMWAAGYRICNGVWLPTPQSFKDPRLSAQGRKISEAIGCTGFPLSVGYYGSPLYGVQPRHRDSMTQAWWSAQCMYERGDAVVCIGRLP